MKAKFGLTTTLLTLVLVLGLFLGACGEGTPKATGPAPDTIKIGAAVPITGSQAGNGAQVKAGYECAVETINKDGGVYVKAYGKKIPLELIILDDQSDATKSVSQLETLYSQYNIVSYLGSMSSALCIAGCAIGEKNKVPWIGISFSVMAPHQQGYKYVFSPFAKSPDDINIYECVKNLSDKPSKAALFMRQEDWGTEMTETFTDMATKYGFSVVYNQTYAPGTTDFSSMIMAAKAAGADMLLGIPITPEAVALMKQLKQLDWAPKFICLIRGADAATWGGVVEGNNVCCMPGWHSNASWPGVDEINTWYQAKFGRPADVLVGPAYACVQILADAIERAGTLDRDDIRDAIAETDMETVEGKIKFRTDGTAIIETIIVCQWQNGKIEAIWPSKHASAQLVYPFPAWSGE